MSLDNWTREQWQAYHRTCDWSESSMIYHAAEKVLSDMGIPIKSLTSLQVFNLQDSIAYAIRRGAIRVINEEHNESDSGDF
jgi:hypothetical protein